MDLVYNRNADYVDFCVLNCDLIIVWIYELMLLCNDFIVFPIYTLRMIENVDLM